MIYLPLILAVLFCVACDIYDVRLTVKGLKAGVAVEGNTFLIGPRPSALALYLRDTLLLAFASGPAILFHFLGNDPLYYGACIGPVVYGIRHIKGGRAWADLLAGKPFDRSPKSIWQKFWS